MEEDKKPGQEGGADLAKEVSRVADALERQNDLRRRLLTGVVFGVGTAVGASIIATVIIVGVARLLAPVGIDLISQLRETRHVLESQIQMQTPQE